MRNALFPVAICVAVAVVLAGCSGRESGGSAPAALTAEEKTIHPDVDLTFERETDHYVITVTLKRERACNNLAIQGEFTTGGRVWAIPTPLTQETQAFPAGHQFRIDTMVLPAEMEIRELWAFEE